MSYSYEEAAQLILRAGKELIEKGLISRTWGNISARLSDTEFLITPSGQAYEDLTPEKLVVVKIRDCSYTGDIRPSSEKGVHAEAYKYREDVNFVVHTHQTLATALSVLGRDLSVSQEYESILGDKIVCGEYGISSTKTLMRKMSKAIKNNLDCNGFLMKYHGVLCLGKDDRHAFAISEAMEDISSVVLGKATGEPKVTVDGLCGAFEQKIGVTETKMKYEDASQDQWQAFFKEQGLFGFLSKHSMLSSYSKAGEKLRPMIDDMAQIVGTEILGVSSKATLEQMKASLGKQNALFINGVGAICVAGNEEDAKAVEQVLEKDLTCHMYAVLMDVVHPLGRLDAYLQRNTYLKKYSKQISH